MMLEQRRVDRIAVLTLQRPPVNALGVELRRALHDYLVAVRSDSSVEAIVLLGAGNGFCAGGDRKEFGTPQAGERPTLSRDVLSAIEACGRPVIAALHGFAMGGGFELALACTARVVVAGTQVGLPEVGIGVIPLSATQRLPRAVGLAQAAALMLSGERWDARSPSLAACFDRIVCTYDELLPAALELARAATLDAPIPLRARPIPGDPRSDLDRICAQLPEQVRTPAQQALVAALRAAVVSSDFDTGLATAQRLFDALGGHRRPSPMSQGHPGDDAPPSANGASSNDA